MNFEVFFLLFSFKLSIANFAYETSQVIAFLLTQFFILNKLEISHEEGRCFVNCIWWTSFNDERWLLLRA